MLDTVRLGVSCDVAIGALAGRGWACYERRKGEDWDVWAKTEGPGGARVSYMAGVGWLACEVSLPELMLGDNALLLGWAGVQEGLERVRELSCDAVGVTLPVVGEWRLSRADSVWAWPVEPAYYVGALRWARLPRTEPRSYEGSVSWLTRSGRIRGRGYDKRRETGRDVELPFRLERQTRPRKEVVRVDGERFPVEVKELSEGQVLGLLGGTMHALGLDAPIPGPGDARRRLVETHGARRGRNLYRVLCEAVELGGWPSDVPASTRRRYQAQLAAAGIRSLSWDGELPPLELPTGG